MYALFFISKTFASNARLKFVKKQAKAKAELLLFENCLLSSSTLSSKNNTKCSKKCQKTNYICLNEVIMINGYETQTEWKIDHIDGT